MTESYVLLIEDDVDLANLAIRFLKKAAIHAVAAHSASQTFSILLTHGLPSAIVMDLTLPDMPSDELIQKLRENEDLSLVPVLVVSGHEDIAEQSLRLGCEAYLKKPFSSQSLIEAVRRLTLVNFPKARDGFNDFSRI